MLVDAQVPMEILIKGLAQRIEAQTGLAFPSSKENDLSRALRRMADEAGFEDDKACAIWLQEGIWDKRKAALCARHLVIRETYFFREPRAFELVCDYAKNKLQQAHGRRQLRIWSAGCCTGEEPYSIAISLLTAMPTLPLDAVHILATDLDAGNLAIAERGIYRQWSFRNNSDAMKGRHFMEAGARQWRVGEAAKKMVRFAQLNLAEAVYPARATDTQEIDIIFCRNVLMYFSPEQVQKVIARFRECLVDGGWLIVNPSEASARLFEGFTAVYHPDAIYYYKTDLAPAKPAVPVIPIMPAAPPPRTFRPLPRVADVPATAEQPHATEGAQYYHLHALIAIEAGDLHAAMESLKRLAYLEPDCVVAHYLMGVVLATSDRHREARRRFHTAAELLAKLDDDEIVPRSDGYQAAAMAYIVRAQVEKVRQ